MKKLAILNTTSCSVAQWSTDHSTILVRFPSKKLHKCLEDGYEVVIITTRTRLHETDKGWSYLISPENIYMPGELEFGGFANDPGLIEPWKKVFERFGLTPPEKAETWLNWMRAAEDQGVRT